MKTKNLFSTILLLAFLLTACGQVTAAPAPMTQPPTNIPTQTSIPFPTIPPYPTASVVKSNAVAFIARNTLGYASLWIANVDGSGERKLTDIERNGAEWTSGSPSLLRWSPDGKWIGYISGDNLWIVSPDGSINKKILSSQDADKKVIRRYAWSPDSTKIAYLLTENWGEFPEIKAGLLDLTTEKNSEIFVYQSPADIVLSWSPNGRYILFDTETSLKIFEVSTGKVRKEIVSSCLTWKGETYWSPNSKWFYRFDYGMNYSAWVCMNSLNGASWRVANRVVSQPVWDKTGDYLYFVIGKMNSDIVPNRWIDQRLMRYDVKTKKVKDILPLEEGGATVSPWSVSISPNGQMLALYSKVYYEDRLRPGYITRPEQSKFVILSIQSLSETKLALEFEGQIQENLPPVWSNDGQKMIFFLKKAVRQNNTIVYFSDGSFYSLDIKTGKVSLFSGEHAIANMIISPIATTP